MALTLYNTATRQSQVFEPLKPGQVSFYTCGPTVYAPAHVGNLRTFVTSDWWRRVLKWNGYQVTTVMNVTDVDDKTIKGSETAGISLSAFTNQYEKGFFVDLGRLNIEPPSATPHATEYIPAMIELIKILLAKDFAYQADDGIYFRVVKFLKYGQLAQIDLGAAGTKSRINNDEYDKETPADFVLWKFESPAAEVAWDAPFGRGRPGWHIECSAMIRAVLGDTIDIHLGGTDLIFPHHTNEIAQSESATGRPLARFWLHSAFITVDGQKMAKSLGNIITLKNLAEKNISPLAYRYLLLTAHYRAILNFTWESLTAADTACRKLRQRLADLAATTSDFSGSPIPEYLNKFSEAINDDLNLPIALSVVWQLLNDHFPPPVNILATILEFDKVLGLDLISATQPLDVSSPVKQLLTDRESARQVGDWPLADSLRQQIETHGYTIEDTPEGPRLKKAQAIAK